MYLSTVMNNLGFIQITPQLKFKLRIWLGPANPLSRGLNPLCSIPVIFFHQKSKLISEETRQIGHWNNVGPSKHVKTNIKNNHKG